MFCHLNYRLDKEFYKNYFFNNIDRAHTHKKTNYELKWWLKLFNSEEVTDKVISEMNLEGLNIFPRFSYQEKNTLLPKHIDKDRIVGININLLQEPVTIHMDDKPYEYECALIDVGAYPHSVEPDSNDRLVLKLAIRNPWSDIYNRLKEGNFLETFAEDYVSEIAQEHLEYVEDEKNE